MSSMRTSTFKQLISVRPSQVSLRQGSWQHSCSPVANSEQYPSNFGPFKFSLPFSFSYTRSSSTFFGISSSDLPIYSGESFISGNKDLNYSTGATRYYSSICRAKSSFSTEFLQKFIRLGEDPGFTHKPTLVEQGGGCCVAVLLSQFAPQILVGVVKNLQLYFIVGHLISCYILLLTRHPRCVNSWTMSILQGPIYLGSYFNMISVDQVLPFDGSYPNFLCTVPKGKIHSCLERS